MNNNNKEEEIVDDAPYIINEKDSTMQLGIYKHHTTLTWTLSLKEQDLHKQTMKKQYQTLTM